MPTLLKCKRQSHLSYSGQDTDGTKTATEFFIVQFDSATTPIQAETATGIPVRGDGHPDDSNRKCNRLESKGNDDSHSIFQVRADYSNATSARATPLITTPSITWDFSESGNEPYFLDKSTDGPGPGGSKPVVNSAGELFQDFLQRATGEIVVTWSLNVSPGTWNPSTAITYHRTVNNDTYTLDGLSITPGQSRCVGISCGGIQIENGVQYRTKKVVLKIRNSWNDVVDERGFNEQYTDGSGNKKLREIVKGQPPVKPDRPWPLNGSGGAATNITDPPPQITFKPYTPAAHASLLT